MKLRLRSIDYPLKAQKTKIVTIQQIEAHCTLHSNTFKNRDVKML